MTRGPRLGLASLALVAAIALALPREGGARGEAGLTSS